MSRHDPIVPGRGRALVTTGGGSVLQRIAQSLGLARRPAIRLLAVPRDPIVGNREAGAALLAGRLRFGPLEAPLAATGLAPGAAPELHERLQSFAWLRDLAAAATPERGREAAEALTRLWLAALPDKAEGPQWRADLWGRRLLFWPAYAPYLLASRDPGYRTAVLRMLVRGARIIEKNGDRVRAGLPRIAAWSGSVAAALLVQGAASRLARCEAGLARALRTGLSEDGGLISRSPAEQLELLELLPLLRAAYATSTHGMPDWLEEAQQGALSTFLCVLAGDGGMTSWQSGNPGDPRRIEAALEAATYGEAPAPQARGWGYQRVKAKEALLVFDAAPPPTSASHPGACASTLAFEFSEGPQRLIVNCGGAGDMASRLPAQLQHLLRSTAAHSALSLGDYNSTAILKTGALGKGVEEVTMERGNRDGMLMVEGSHDGYVRRFGLVHHRQLLLGADGKSLQGIDSLSAKAKPGKKPVAFAMRFHLAPGVEVTSTADGRGAILRVRGRTAWQFKVRGGRLDVEEGLWIDGGAQPRVTQQLAVTGESPPEGMTISWELKRAA